MREVVLRCGRKGVASVVTAADAPPSSHVAQPRRLRLRADRRQVAAAPLTKQLVGHELDGQEGKRGAGGGEYIVVNPISVGPVLPRTGSSGLPGAAGLGLLPGREGRRRAHQQWLHLGRTFPRCVDHLRDDDGELLAVTQTRFVNEEVSASLPALSYAVPAVSLSGCRAVDQGPGKVDTDAEVGDKAVTEVLGGEIIQRRGCEQLLVIAAASCPWSCTCCMSCASAGQSPCWRSRWSSWSARATHRCSGGVWVASMSRLLTSLTACRGSAAARRGLVFQSASPVRAGFAEPHWGGTLSGS